MDTATTTMTIPDWAPWFVQLGDSQFPSGSYAHSLGLEGLVQLGVVHDTATLRENLRAQVIPALLAFDVPFLLAARERAAAGDVAGLAALDHELDAWRMAAELRDASRRIGSRRLALLGKLAPEDALVSGYLAASAPCHLLAVAGIEHRATPPGLAALSFCYQAVHAVCSAALKLIRIGQEACHGLLREAARLLADGLPTAMERGVDAAGWFDPLTEIAALQHARSRERLFIS
jgi:urease accessory protein